MVGAKEGFIFVIKIEEKAFVAPRCRSQADRTEGGRDRKLLPCYCCEAIAGERSTIRGRSALMGAAAALRWKEALVGAHAHPASRLACHISRKGRRRRRDHQGPQGIVY